MNKKTGIVVGAVIVVILSLIGIIALRNNDSGSSSKNTSTSDGYNTYERGLVADVASRIDYSNLDLNTIISAQDFTGNLPENIEGKADAPVVIYEYADFQCSYCAMMNPYMNEIVEDYDGKVAVVFRSYILPYHENSTMVASAVEAAAIQGYWQKYKDLIFANQSDWYYLSDDGLREYLEQYFVKVAGTRGDLDKFRTDMASEAVVKKVAFDFGAADKMDIGGTPWFYLDGEWIDIDNLSPEKYAEKIRKVIDAKLEAK